MQVEIVLVGSMLVGNPLFNTKSDICFCKVISALLKSSDGGTVISFLMFLDSSNTESFDSESSESESESEYRGSPTSTVSCSTISTSTVFQCYVLKTVLVEFLCTINRTSGNWLCSTH